MLQNAIEAYESGFRADMRDYYPGVNAVTLRILRGSKEDLDAALRLAPVVSFAVDAAPKPKNDSERYWQIATKLELAGAAREWDSAAQHGTTLLGVPAQDWMRETTIKNLRLQRKAFRADQTAVKAFDDLIASLTPAKRQATSS